MSEASDASRPAPLPAKKPPEAGREFLVSAAPHLADGVTTQRIMFEVVLALTPLFLVAVYMYRMPAVVLTITTVVACLITEAAFNWARGRSQASLTDGSAVVTGVILAFSLPPRLNPYMAAIGGAVAIGLAKMIFGGLGQNLFNPAMIGRAFLMVCFPVAMTTWSEPETLKLIGVDAVTQATPLAAVKFHSAAPAPLADLFIGRVGGCIGETSALAAIIGGLYLILRGIADWRQPVGMLGAAALFAAIAHHFAPDKCAGVLYHLNSGALMFGAFFIATDYVGAPVTPRGRLLFGIGAGLLVMLIRVYGGYPEGVMYAILIMNALTPLIERWTVPTPFGGKATG